MQVGITGSFGSGKSSVTRCFRELGARFVDSDASVAKIYASDTDFRDQLREKFGDGVFGTDGQVDRKALGHRVFNHAEELLWLENALHPRVRAMRLKQVSARPDALWIIEIPLLFEKNLEKEVDRSISVVASYSLRVSRLRNRGFSPDEVQARSSKQLPQHQKIERADFVILNDGSVEFLKRQVEHLFKRLRY